MNRTYVFLVAAVLLVAVVTGWNVAQERKATPKSPPKPAAVAAPAANAAQKPAAGAPAANASPNRTADEEAVKGASQAFVKAFESGDAKTVFNLFTEEAEYIDEDGEPVHGRAALAKAYEGFFAQRKELKAESKSDSIRFLGTDTAIEEGTFTVTAKDSAPDASRYSALYVRQNGKWLIALLKEWGDDTTSKPNLQDLAWLIGTWESDGDEMSARTTYEWTANKNFIKAQYTLTPKKAGEPESSGTQVIGVDPAVDYIRAWLFSSDGGIGESTWAWDGGRWMIESVGTLVDGSHTSALNLLTRVGDDSFTWRSVQRTVDGEDQPDIAAITVKRVAAPGTTTQKPKR